MNMIMISPDDALAHWATISALFKQAYDKGQGESSMSDYMKKILNKHAQCWVILEDDKITAAGLTEFMYYSQHKTLHIILFTGTDFEEQSKMFPIVEAFAKAEGCKAIEQWGRPGWAKVLPRYVPGFHEVYTVMRKDL